MDRLGIGSCLYCITGAKDKAQTSVEPVCALCCRDEATRTPDPYVPNVVRYQLRYIPFAGAKVQLIFQLLAFFFKKICGNR